MRARKQLCAYVVPESTLPPISELREFLSQDLPEYNLPAIFVRLDELHRQVQLPGKVDRAALPRHRMKTRCGKRSFLINRRRACLAGVASLLGLGASA